MHQRRPQTPGSFLSQATGVCAVSRPRGTFQAPEFQDCLGISHVGISCCVTHDGPRNQATSPTLFMPEEREGRAHAPGDQREDHPHRHEEPSGPQLLGDRHSITPGPAGNPGADPGSIVVPWDICEAQATSPAVLALSPRVLVFY